jgi:uncharacterized protein YndB with AHSA1/START domain
MKALAKPEWNLALSRRIAAAPAQVFEAWTDPGLMREWWGPEGCETVELLAEPRPGGKYRWLVTGPDGGRMAVRGEFREVEPNQKIVFTWSWDGDEQWENHDSVVTVTFQEATGGTDLRLAHEHLPSESSRANHEEGWNSALDKLEKRWQQSPVGGLGGQA